MGYGTGKDAINRWRLVERVVLERICKEHGIEISAPEKSRGSLTVEQYKEYAELKEKTEAQRQEVKQLDNEISNKELILEWREQAIENAEADLEQLGSELQEKREGVEHLEAEITEKSATLSETSSALADNRTLLKESAEKVSQIKSVDSIETGKTGFGGKVTVARDDYDKITDLAKKQIAAENREGELTAEDTKMKKENEEVVEKTTILERKVQRLYPLKEALRKAENELGSLKAKYQKILDFVEGIKAHAEATGVLEKENHHALKAYLLIQDFLANITQKSIAKFSNMCYNYY